MSFDYEQISLMITKRAADQLRRVAVATGRPVDSLAEAAVEEACIRSEQEYPPAMRKGSKG